MNRFFASPQKFCDNDMCISTEWLEPPHAWVTPQPRHRCHDVSVAVACHSTSHTQATVLRWRPFANENKCWPTTSHLSQPFPTAATIGLVVISMEAYILYWFLHGGVYSRWLLTLNTGQFFLLILNLWARQYLPFCQKSVLAVVQAVIGCNKAARRTK